MGKKQPKKPIGRPPAPQPRIDAPAKSVVNFVLRTRKPPAR